MPSINTNVAAIKARSNLDRVQRDMDTSIARLSSGKRITRAADDAAGQAIAGRMESQIRGLTMQIRNAKDGQALVDTQEGAMQEITTIMQRMRELAVQSSSGIASATDKGYLNTEMTALVAEINAISKNTVFNDVSVLEGATFSFYTDIDANGTAVTTDAADMAMTAIIVTAVGQITIAAQAITNISSVISYIDTGIKNVAEIRSKLGATSNRFNHIIDNLTNVVANTEGAKSRIMDADFAVETTALTRNTVLQQAATSMVAQANSSKNSILALIQG
jgi:flagellin